MICADMKDQSYSEEGNNLFQIRNIPLGGIFASQDKTPQTFHIESVALLVANHDRLAYVDIEISHGLQDEPWPWLTAIAFNGVLLDSSFGVVGAEVEGIDRGLMFDKLIRDPGMDGFDSIFREKSPCNPRLITQDNHKVSAGYCILAEIEYPLNEADAIGGRDVASIRDYDSVPVEE